MVKLNTPIEVNKAQCLEIVTAFRGVVAHREENGRYFVKTLLPGYAKYIKQYLK